MSSDSSFSKPLPVVRALPRSFIAVMAVVATVFLFLASQLVASVLLGLGAVAAHQSIPQWFDTTEAQFIYVLMADILLIGGIAACLRWFRWNWATIGLRWPAWWQPLLGIASAVPYYVLLLLIINAVKAAVPALNVDQQQELGFHDVQGALPLALTFLSLIVLPPLVEEVVMRGFLYTSLRQRLPVIVATLIVSLLFGAAHLSEGGATGLLWVGAIDTFILSLVLCILREKTGNIWAGIMLHATKNAVAFALLFIIHA